MRTKIISAFPGVGKTYYSNKHPDKALDSDSSNFSWTIENGQKIRSSEFPNNYIRHIKENIGKYEYIFVSSHKEVRKALKDNCLFFYLVFPQKMMKNEFIERYKDRGNSEDFIKLVSDNWEQWIDDCKFEGDGCKPIETTLKNFPEKFTGEPWVRCPPWARFMPRIVSPYFKQAK